MALEITPAVLVALPIVTFCPPVAQFALTASGLTSTKLGAATSGHTIRRPAPRATSMFQLPRSWRALAAVPTARALALRSSLGALRTVRAPKCARASVTTKAAPHNARRVVCGVPRNNPWSRTPARARCSSDRSRRLQLAIGSRPESLADRALARWEQTSSRARAVCLLFPCPRY